MKCADKCMKLKIHWLRWPRDAKHALSSLVCSCKYFDSYVDLNPHQRMFSIQKKVSIPENPNWSKSGEQQITRYSDLINTSILQPKDQGPQGLISHLAIKKKLFSWNLKNMAV